MTVHVTKMRRVNSDFLLQSCWWRHWRHRQLFRLIGLAPKLCGNYYIYKTKQVFLSSINVLFAWGGGGEDFFDEGNYYTVTRCLLLDDISMGKVTKHLLILLTCLICFTHSWREVQKRFLIELLELNTLNEHSSYEFLMRKKVPFLFWKTIFDKVLK